MLVIGNLNEKKYEIIMKDKPINEIKKMMENVQEKDDIL